MPLGQPARTGLEPAHQAVDREVPEAPRGELVLAAERQAGPALPGLRRQMEHGVGMVERRAGLRRRQHRRAGAEGTGAGEQRHAGRQVAGARVGQEQVALPQRRRRGVGQLVRIPAELPEAHRQPPQREPGAALTIQKTGAVFDLSGGRST